MQSPKNDKQMKTEVLLFHVLAQKNWSKLISFKQWKKIAKFCKLKEWKIEKPNTQKSKDSANETLKNPKSENIEKFKNPQNEKIRKN